MASGTAFLPGRTDVLVVEIERAAFDSSNDDPVSAARVERRGSGCASYRRWPNRPKGCWPDCVQRCKPEDRHQGIVEFAGIVAHSPAVA